MRSAAILALFLAAFAAIAQPQQRRVVIGGGPDPEATRDWPQPEIREGLTDEQIVAAIESYAGKLAEGDHFSGVILVAKDGKPILTRAWGMATETAKNTTDTKFNIGSINKAFTRAAIEQLATAGKLSLDDTLRKHLADYPSPVADRITIRQLLEHQSGLGDIFGDRYRNAPPSKLRELRDFLPLFADQPLKYEPGTSQSYSNAGYVVLGLVIEKITGQTYRDYVQKNVFAPAGMKNTGFWAIDESVPNRATGYTRRGPDGPLEKRGSNLATLPGRPSSAGGAYATASDLLRFALWSKEQGMGIAGGSPGTNAIVEKNGPWVVVALSNYDPPSAETLGMNAMSIIRGRKPEPMMRSSMATEPDTIDMRGPVDVPLTPLEHLFTVEAMVNGKGPFHLVIDTGAGGMMRVSEALAKTLGLQKTGEVRSGDPSGQNVSTRALVRVDSVEIGGARFGGIDASIGGGAGPLQPDGVIGLALFGQLTVTLDHPKQQLRLRMRPLAADGEHVIAFTRDHGIPTIEVAAGDAKFQAHVDTGSPAFLSVTPDTKLAFTGEPRVVGRGRTANNEFEIRAAELDGEVRIAGWSASHPMVDIAGLFPIANVGSRFLRQYAVTFDLTNNRLGLAK
jgi:CubicO group peptidase (beta-lactamase class C family)